MYMMSMHDDCAATMVYIGGILGQTCGFYLGDGDRHELALKLTLKMPDFGISIVRDISALSSAIPVVPATTSVATSTGLYFFRLVM